MKLKSLSTVLDPIPKWLLKKCPSVTQVLSHHDSEQSFVLRPYAISANAGTGDTNIEDGITWFR